MNKYLGIAVLLSVMAVGYGQQEANLTLYRYHMNVFNPAVVGVDGETYINSTFRRQWANIPQAPATEAVSFGAAMGRNLGIGISLINDRTFVEAQTGTYIDFSYRVKLSERTDLYLGIKAGGNNYRLNTAGLETYSYTSDPSLNNIQSFNPNIGAGAYLKGEKYHFSLAVPRLVESSYATDGDGVATVGTQRIHLYVSGGYQFDLSADWTLLPTAFLRYVGGAPVSVDFTGMLSYANVLDFGASYRTDEAISGIAAIRLSERFTVGYAYETSLLNNLRGRVGNTHEFIMRFRLAPK